MITPQNMLPTTTELNKVIAIQQCFGDFYSAVCNANNPQTWDIISAIITRIKNVPMRLLLQGLIILTMQKSVRSK